MRFALPALTAQQEALPLREQLVKEAPGDEEYERELTEVHNSLGMSTLSMREYEEALVWFAKTEAGFRALAEKHPEDAKFRSDWGRALLNQGIALKEMKKPTESLPVFRKSLPVQQEAAAMRPGKYRYRELTAMVYQREADAYRLLDKPAEAAASTDKRRRIWTIEAEPLIDVAADLAQCIPLVGKGARTSFRTTSRPSANATRTRCWKSCTRRRTAATPLGRRWPRTTSSRRCASARNSRS